MEENSFIIDEVREASIQHVSRAMMKERKKLMIHISLMMVSSHKVKGLSLLSD